MPLLPGEERLVTVYADIHYYFAQPSIRPHLHRFDKASYFYIYYNSTRHSSRLEVANNPGTPEQDAFNGYLDGCRIINSHKFPTLLTIVVDPPDSVHSPTPSSPVGMKDAQEWQLISADPRDQSKHLFKLHTLDVYFWVEDDAKLVTGVLKKLLHPSQLDIVEAKEPASTHDDSTSHVVQNLENVAISDPAYRNGQTRNSQNQPYSQKEADRSEFQPAAHSPSPLSQHSHTEAANPQAYAPMAYNPAAPPAPEPIAHREDTPPPADATDGTGLSSAAMRDHAYSQNPSLPPQLQQQPYTGIPGPAASGYGHYGSPPPPTPAAQQTVLTQPPTTTPSFAPPPASTSPSSNPASSQRHPSIAQQTYAPPPVDPMAHLYGAASPPVQSPGAQLYGSLSQPQHHQPVQHVQPQYADYLSSRPAPPPVGGYSQYSYDPASSQSPPAAAGTSAYDVHNQVYRPTEAEANSGHGGGGGGRKHSSSASAGTGASGAEAQEGSGRRPSMWDGRKWDGRADRAEKGVNRLLKKIEKRIG